MPKVEQVDLDPDLPNLENKAWNQVNVKPRAKAFRLVFQEYEIYETTDRSRNRQETTASWWANQNKDRSLKVSTFTINLKNRRTKIFKKKEQLSYHFCKNAAHTPSINSGCVEFRPEKNFRSPIPQSNDLGTWKLHGNPLLISENYLVKQNKN